MTVPDAANLAPGLRRSVFEWLESPQGRIARQFAVFLSVGVASALLDIGTLAAIMWLGVHYSIATTIAFLTALIFNYFAHARVTFKVASSSRSMFRYGVVVMVNYAMTLAMVTASEYWLGGFMVGKLASLPILAGVGYLSGRYWIFH